MDVSHNMAECVLKLSFVERPLSKFKPEAVAAFLVALTLVLALLVASPSHPSVNTGVGPSLPPSVILEAALDTERLSTSKTRIVRILRFFLRQIHVLFLLRHEIVPDVPSVERQLTKSHVIFDQHPMGTAMLRRIFGCHFRADMGRAEYAKMHDAFMKAIARDFVNEAAVISTLNRADIGGRISDLINFSGDPAHQQPWERMGRVNPINAITVEIDDLETMLKALSSCIAIPLLYGHDYLERNPSTLQDWDCFASQAVPLLVLGLPTWVPLPSFQQGVAARDRLLKSQASVYRRMHQYHDGESVDHSADMSDVSETIQNRFKVFDRHNLSVDAISQIEIFILWAQNKKAQQLLFWYEFYVYSVPGLVAALREDVAASGAISLSESSGQRRITAVNISTLRRQCLLLRSCFLESFRLAEESVMFRQVTQPVTSHQQQLTLKAGS